MPSLTQMMWPTATWPMPRAAPCTQTTVQGPTIWHCLQLLEYLSQTYSLCPGLGAAPGCTQGSLPINRSNFNRLEFLFLGLYTTLLWGFGKRSICTPLTNIRCLGHHGYSQNLLKLREHTQPGVGGLSRLGCAYPLYEFGKGVSSESWDLDGDQKVRKGPER